jgi:glycosyltransferase involved in cell wall biosynthesis
MGLPVYNGAKHLRQALDALLAQDYPNFELVISDNASTDETAAICQEYSGRTDRVRYSRSPVNRGSVWNFNRVFELSRGEFFMWAAHDDLWAPSCIRRCVEALQAHPDAALCHSGTQPIKGAGEPAGEPYLGDAYRNEERTLPARWRRSITSQRLYVCIYGLMRRAMAEKTRLLQVCNGEDFVFVCELTLQGTIIHVCESLSSKRVPDSMADYLTHDEMLVYLGGPRKKAWLVYSKAYRQLLAGLKHAKLEPQVHRRLVWEVGKGYFTARIWLMDARASVARILGRR